MATQASGNNFWIDVEMRGVQEMFTRLSKAGAKTKDIQPILRKAALPLKQEAKLTAPKNEKNINTIHATVRKHYGGGKVKLKTQIHAPGNLRRSIDIFKSKKTGSLLFVGNLVGRSARYDGWYGRLITFGFKPGKKGTTVKPNDFMGRSVNRRGSEVLSRLTDGLMALIEKYENK